MSGKGNEIENGIVDSGGLQVEKYDTVVADLNSGKLNIFDLDEFPYTTKPYSITPRLVKNMLDIYANSDISMVDLCKRQGIEYTYLLRVVDTFPQINSYYSQAQIDKAELYREQLIEISDDSTNDYITRQSKNGTEYTQLNPESSRRSELRIKTRQWLMSRMNPDKYGDKQQIDVTSKNINANVSVEVDSESFTSLAGLMSQTGR